MFCVKVKGFCRKRHRHTRTHSSIAQLSTQLVPDGMLHFQWHTAINSSLYIGEWAIEKSMWRISLRHLSCACVVYMGWKLCQSNRALQDLWMWWRSVAGCCFAIGVVDWANLKVHVWFSRYFSRSDFFVFEMHVRGTFFPFYESQLRWLAEVTPPQYESLVIWWLFKKGFLEVFSQLVFLLFFSSRFWTKFQEEFLVLRWMDVSLMKLIVHW